MPEYQVDLDIRGQASVRVTAETEDEACSLAERVDFSDVDGFDVYAMEAGLVSVWKRPSERVEGA